MCVGLASAAVAAIAACVIPFSSVITLLSPVNSFSSTAYREVMAAMPQPSPLPPPSGQNSVISSPPVSAHERELVKERMPEGSRKSPPEVTILFSLSSFLSNDSMFYFFRGH